MDHPRPCGCKGCRTCLICEKEYGIEDKPFIEKYQVNTNFINFIFCSTDVCNISFQNLTKYVYCIKCNLIFQGDDITTVNNYHDQHKYEVGLEFPGVHIQTDFINETEESDLMHGIDSLTWDTSQSGRRKQVLTATLFCII